MKEHCSPMTPHKQRTGPTSWPISLWTDVAFPLCTSAFGFATIAVVRYSSIAVILGLLGLVVLLYAVLRVRAEARRQFGITIASGGLCVNGDMIEWPRVKSVECTARMIVFLTVDGPISVALASLVNSEHTLRMLLDWERKGKIRVQMPVSPLGLRNCLTFACAAWLALVLMISAGAVFKNAAAVNAAQLAERIAPWITGLGWAYGITSVLAWRWGTEIGARVSILSIALLVAFELSSPEPVICCPLAESVPLVVCVTTLSVFFVCGVYWAAANITVLASRRR